MSEYLNKSQLKKLGIFKIGKNCKISKKIRTYSLNCSIGDNVRIDDDVILKGKINIYSNVHIARGCTLSGGKNGIILGKFSGLSNFCQIFTVSDNFLSSVTSAATFNDKDRKKFCRIHSKKVFIGKCVIIGPFSVILPGARIEDFSTVGPYSCIFTKIKKGYFVSNISTKKINYKKRNILELEKIYEKYLKNYR